jgi:hypothetical protein
LQKIKYLKTFIQLLKCEKSVLLPKLTKKHQYHDENKGVWHA